MSVNILTESIDQPDETKASWCGFRDPFVGGMSNWLYSQATGKERNKRSPMFHQLLLLF